MRPGGCKDILILFSRTGAASETGWLSKAYTLLSEEFRAENERWLLAKDRTNRAAARLLLTAGLEMLGLGGHRAASLKKDSSGRPFIPECEIDLSITHTDGLAAAALSCVCRVGIDAERIRPLKAEDYIEAFSKNEAEQIGAAKEPSWEILRLWTRKEALLKAHGTGLLTEPSQADASAADTILFGEKYHIEELYMGRSFAAHLAAAPWRSFRTIELTAEELLGCTPKLEKAD